MSSSAANASASPPQPTTTCTRVSKTRSRTIRMVSYNVSMARPSVQAPGHWTYGGAAGGGASSSSSPSSNGNDYMYGRRYVHASDLLSAILGHRETDDDAAAAAAPRAPPPNNGNHGRTEGEVRLRNEILRTRPDIVALQECPTTNWSTRMICALTTNTNNHQHCQHQYVSVGTARSHCGYVDLLVRSDWTFERMDLQRQQYQQERGMHLPSVAAMVNIPLLEANHSSSSSSSFARLAVSSSHLAPHRENAPTRFDQLQRLVWQMEQRDETGPGATDLILLGDMNMRKEEDGRVERIGWVPPPSACQSGGSRNAGGLLDAWKEAGSDLATRDTWDSYVNRYHGADAFEFRCRFDRTYYRPAAALAEVESGGGGTSSSLRVVDFGLVGNRPILRDQGGGGPSHFLSDHFGMSMAFEVARLEDDGCSEDISGGGGERTASHETQPSRKKTKLMPE